MGITRDVLPEAWATTSVYCDASPPSSFPSECLEWSEKALLDAFRRISAVQSRAKSCFFVDGLDEYFSENDKDHDFLLFTLGYLTKAGVKLCVASRPWNVFEEAYGNDISRKLYLEDLNRKDIERYVLGKLTTHQNLAGIDPTEADDIVKEIIDKSHGAFLWVRLAVRSLIEGLRNRDSVVLLRRRLREFPDDLNGFFKYMFESLDPIYRPRLSHMFQIALVADEPLWLIAYWYLDRIEDERDTGSEPSTEPFTWMESLQVMEVMKFRINGRSRGLLETTKDYHTQRKGGKDIEDHVDPHIDFLHRTVRDYILTMGVQTMLKEWRRGTFEADLTLCKVTLTEFKLRIGESGDRIKPLMRLFYSATSRAEDADAASDLLRDAYLEEFANTVARHAQSRPQEELSLWKLVRCHLSLDVLLKHNMRKSFVRRIKTRPPSQLERVCCYHILLTTCVYELPGLDTDSVFEYMNLLLSPKNPIKTDPSFLDTVKTLMKIQDDLGATSMLVGLSRYDFVDKKTKLDARFRNRLLTKLLSSDEWNILADYLSKAVQSSAGIAPCPASFFENEAGCRDAVTAVTAVTAAHLPIANLPESAVAHGTQLKQHSELVVLRKSHQSWLKDLFRKSR